ncbi:MAG: hypothetical protein ACLFU1_02515 [Alphaproteobacteria bacterium]
MRSAAATSVTPVAFSHDHGKGLIINVHALGGVNLAIITREETKIAQIVPPHKYTHIARALKVGSMQNVSASAAPLLGAGLVQLNTISTQTKNFPETAMAHILVSPEEIMEAAATATPKEEEENASLETWSQQIHAAWQLTQACRRPTITSLSKTQSGVSICHRPDAPPWIIARELTGQFNTHLPPVNLDDASLTLTGRGLVLERKTQDGSSLYPAALEILPPEPA